jgi:hypothetical protein
MQSLVLSSISSWEFHRGCKKLIICKGTDNSVYEDIKQELCISRPRGALWVELNAKVWLADMANTLVAAVIGIHEQLTPFRWQAVCIHSITVILGCNVTFSSQHIRTGDIVSTVSELHLESARASSSSEKLMPKTNTKNWCPILCHCRCNMFDSLVHDRWITGTVGDEETIVVLASKGWKVIVPRTDQNFYPSLQEAAQLVVLQSNIQTQNTYGSTGRML